MSFLSNLDQFGQGINRASVTLAKPPRARFVAAASEQIRQIETNSSSPSNWYIQNSDGTVDVTLRNGVAILKVGGASKRRCANADAATAYIKAAITAVEAGELDEMLEATQLKRKPKSA
ncbi:hypothetical protein [Paucibacter sp. KCTC 42545]|uniref:hypothetical protein n=1 Tax=Paucibacter sp. KCTC 42545 TaxID=1768242 RepID=UPI000733AD64|nr:hypothetical protein [Paucibacter sp. KCTC 42545]ALT76992.1 hypothetical protein AT984_07090 [Paucibacter sp. KCTC 42545]